MKMAIGVLLVGGALAVNKHFTLVKQKPRRSSGTKLIPTLPTLPTRSR